MIISDTKLNFMRRYLLDDHPITASDVIYCLLRTNRAFSRSESRTSQDIMYVFQSCAVFALKLIIVRRSPVS